MPDPVCCEVCGLPLPEVDFPGVQTCREWADTVARQHGDMLLEEIARGLDFLLAYCRLFAAIRTGQESIGEP
jgi:hypothetical protein